MSKVAVDLFIGNPFLCRGYHCVLLGGNGERGWVCVLGVDPHGLLAISGNCMVVCVWCRHVLIASLLYRGFW